MIRIDKVIDGVTSDAVSYLGVLSSLFNMLSNWWGNFWCSQLFRGT